MTRFAYSMIGAALLWMSGCGSGQKTASTPVPSAQETAERASTEVTLSKEAQERGGVSSIEACLEKAGTSITASGRVAPNADRTWNVGSFVAGRVTELNVNLGDRVKEGQVLLRLHSHEVHDTRGAFLMAREALRQTQTRAAHLERVRDRARRLLALQAMSQEQADAAETDWKASLAEVESAKAALERERTHLAEVLEIPFTSSGDPEDIETVPVRAPASGIVIERKATIGTVTSPGDVLFTLTDPFTVWVFANANEADLPALTPGQKVDVEVKAWPGKEFAGRILRLGESLDPATRTLQVRVLVPNPQGLLKPEMFATVRIEHGSTREAILLPREAIQQINGQATVFVQTSDITFRPQPVAVSNSMGDRVEISQGVKPGEKVVVHGSFAVRSELMKRVVAEG